MLKGVVDFIGRMSQQGGGLWKMDFWLGASEVPGIAIRQ